uniref:Uncharacterized protein n=1 Tax=Strigamia maritima TaxID=126957 RepID=T1IPF8_STRMM
MHSLHTALNTSDEPGTCNRTKPHATMRSSSFENLVMFFIICSNKRCIISVSSICENKRLQSLDMKIVILKTTQMIIHDFEQFIHSFARKYCVVQVNVSSCLAMGTACLRSRSPSDKSQISALQMRLKSNNIMSASELSQIATRLENVTARLENIAGKAAGDSGAVKPK